MISLDTLALQYGTDKGPRNHNYMRHYQELFAACQGQPLTVLELGVQEGASLQVWHDYFPQSQIVGVDIEERCRIYEQDRIAVRIGDQSDASFLTALAEEFGGFDIVIDDASHNGDGSRASFEILYPHVKPAGIYIVEDLHTAYFGWGVSFVNYTTGNLLEKVLWPGGRAFSHGHGDPRNHPNWEQIRAGMDAFSRETKSVTCLSSLIVFQKWPAEEVF